MRDTGFVLSVIAVKRVVIANDVLFTMYRFMFRIYSGEMNSGEMTSRDREIARRVLEIARIHLKISHLFTIPPSFLPCRPNTHFSAP